MLVSRACSLYYFLPINLHQHCPKQQCNLGAQTQSGVTVLAIVSRAGRKGPDFLLLPLPLRFSQGPHLCPFKIEALSPVIHGMFAIIPTFCHLRFGFKELIIYCCLSQISKTKYICLYMKHYRNILQ